MPLGKISRTPTQEYATLVPEQLTPTNSVTGGTGGGTPSRHLSAKQKRIKMQTSDEPVLFEDLTNTNARSSMQLPPRHSEDDDLERGVQEITVAMHEPEGSFVGLTTDEAIT